MKPLLSLTNVNKTFEVGTPNENHVLKGIDLEMNEGDFITIIGGNGAGKSTFLNSIAGSFPIDQGSILLDGEEISDLPAYKRADRISRVFQDTRMGTASRLSIEENLSVAMKRGQRRSLKSGIQPVNRAFYQEQLAKLNLGLENRLSMDVGLLSGGQRQAVTLLMATIVTPRLLLLDEHTAALDPKTSEQVVQLTEDIVGEKNITTLMITHDMNQAIDMGNRLIMLHEGQIVVDISGEEKAHLTVEQLVSLFQKNSGSMLADDSLILG